MIGKFQLASGSVIGRDHFNARKNGQDAFRILQHSNVTVAVVCDGCGEIRGGGNRLDSEVGAKLGSYLLTQAIASQAQRLLRIYERGNEPVEVVFGDSFFRSIRQNVLAQLRVLALEMGDSLSEIVQRHFLFTVVGVLITPIGSVFFSMGDGVIIFNEEVLILEAREGNEPVYFVYGGLAPSSLEETNPELLRLQLHQYLGPEELKTFLLGCDGVKDLMAAADKLQPNGEHTVGSISQFWETETFFTTSFGLQKRLNLLVQGVNRVSPEGGMIVRPGLLADDTTIVVGRRVHQEETG